jgi:LuxR family transcriptional regulator of csgAB operon
MRANSPLRGPPPLADRAVFIVGPRRLQNKLMAFFLENQTGATCVSVPDFTHIAASAKDDNHEARLALWDCLGKDLHTCIQEIDEKIGELLPHDFLGLFNLRGGLGIEEDALVRGAKGFFYEHEPVEVFTKGIETIFNEGLWISRKILTEYIERNRHRKHPPKENAAGLTRREYDVLSLVSVGATNKDVANELCISRHTVKCHLYNIFKKIGVTNRFQVARWAAKNL